MTMLTHMTTLAIITWGAQEKGPKIMFSKSLEFYKKIIVVHTPHKTISYCRLFLRCHRKNSAWHRDSFFSPPNHQCMCNGGSPPIISILWNRNIFIHSRLKRWIWGEYCCICWPLSSWLVHQRQTEVPWGRDQCVHTIQSVDWLGGDVKGTSSDRKNHIWLHFHKQIWVLCNQIKCITWLSHDYHVIEILWVLCKGMPTWLSHDWSTLEIRMHSQWKN